jgi:hypothetical protein
MLEVRERSENDAILLLKLRILLAKKITMKYYRKQFQKASQKDMTG